MIRANFRAQVLPDGKVVVRNVPIFAECEKEGFKFDAGWIDDAVAYHHDHESNGGMSVVHVNHHGSDAPVSPAGAWTNTRRAWLRTKDGRRVRGVVVDLVFTDEAAWKRAKRGQLLWRSPEIPVDAATRKSRPRFRSLALLDRNAPHNDDLPVLSFEGRSVPFSRNSAPRTAVLAFATDGDAVRALMEPETMAEKKPRKKADEVVKLESDAPPAEDKGGSEGGDTGAWKAKLDELKACEVKADEIPEFVAALREFADSLAGEPDAPEEPEDLPEEPLMDAPGDPTQPMQETKPAVALQADERVIALAAEVEALKAREKARDARDRLAAAVDAAHAKVRDRGVTREDVLKFSEGFGDQAVLAAERYADAILAKVPAGNATFEEVVDAAATTQAVPDAVLKFQSEGPEAYAWALNESRLHKQAVDAGVTSQPLDRWLENKKPGGAFVRAPAGE